MTEELGEITATYMVTFKRRSKHSPARLWSALTAPDEVAVWMEGPARVDLQVGGDWHIDFSSSDEGELDGIIVRIEPERLLGYVWGWSYVEWVIEADGDGCTYTFVQNGLADRGEGEEGLAAGWHGFLDQLEAHLDGAPIPKDEAKADWKRRHAPYLKLLEAAIR